MDFALTWDGWPPTSFTQGSDSYYYLSQMWAAQREKYWAALAQRIWPRTNSIQAGGFVGSITVDPDDATKLILTDSGENPEGVTQPNDWHLPSTGGWGTGDLWAGASGTDVSYRPTEWDCIIAFDDVTPWKQVRAHITANTTGDITSSTDPDTGITTYTVVTAATLTVENYSDYVTAGVISSINPPSGAKFYIIEAGGLWWSDFNPSEGRWPDWQNTVELDYGSIYSSTTTSAILSSLSIAQSPDPHRIYQPKLLVGAEILMYVGDVLERVTITKSSTDSTTGFPQITFDELDDAPTPGDAQYYTILEAGGVGFPGRFGKSGPWESFSGAFDMYQVHNPDDSVSARGVVVTSEFDFAESDDPDADCTDTVSHPQLVNDGTALGWLDVWSAFQNFCSPSDHSYAPNFFKSLSALQSDQDDVAAFYAGDLDYPQTNRSPKQTYTKALLYYDADVNSGQSSVSETGAGETANYYATVDSSYNGWPIYWTVLKGDQYGSDKNTERLSGISVASGGQINLAGPEGLFDDVDFADNPSQLSDLGAVVIYSPGRTRYFEKMFHDMYPQTFFVPDVLTDPDTGISTPIDPPSIQDYADNGCALGAGIWTTRGPSTQYMQFGMDGKETDVGAVFANGDYARYMGVSWAYPTEHAAGSDATDVTIPYWDHAAETTHQLTVQAKLREDAIGTITDVLPGNVLQDTTKHWWVYWYNGGTMRVDSGTATAAGSTSLIDSSKATGEPNCFWASTRFPLFSYSWQGFILEVDHGLDDMGNPVTYYLPITGCTPSSGEVTFASVGVTFAEGDAYRIKEPAYGLNRYATRQIIVTRSDKTTFSEVVKLNDDQRIYGMTTTLEAGWTYEIVEYYPGGTYKWVVVSGAGSWVPTNFAMGTDTRSGAHGFRAHPEQNDPDWVVGYGYMCAFDITTDLLYEEWYTINNLLYVIPVPVTWRSRLDLATAENNSKYSNGGQYGPSGSLTYPDYFSDGGDSTPIFASVGDSLTHNGTSVAYSGSIVQADYYWGAVTAGSGIDGDTGPGDPFATWGELDNTPPYSYSDVNVFEIRIDGVITGTSNFTGGDTDVTLQALYSYAKLSTTLVMLPSATKFYAYAQIPHTYPETADWETTEIDPIGMQDITGAEIGAFDDNGTGLVKNDWHIIGSIASSSDTDRSSGALGNINQPDAASPLEAVSGYGTAFTNDFPESIDGASSKGFEVVDAIALLDFSDAMNFIPE